MDKPDYPDNDNALINVLASLNPSPPSDYRLAADTARRSAKAAAQATAQAAADLTELIRITDQMTSA